MPALVNINVGSLRGTSGDDGTTSCPSRAKKSRKLDRISLTPLICRNSLMAQRFPVQERRVRSGPARHISAVSPPRCHRELAMNDHTAPIVRSLEERLKAGRFVITAELAPPVSADAADLRGKAAALKGLPDAVNVTDGAGARAHMAALAAASILAGMGIEPILQITCRDKNRIALQSEIMGAAALGIRNLLLLTGDDPKAGDQPDTKPVFDVDSKTLIEIARRLRDEGTLPTGRKVSGKAAFFIGAADMPIDPPAGW